MKKGQKDNYMSENVLTVDNAEYITDILSKEVGWWTKAAAADSTVTWRVDLSIYCPPGGLHYFTDLFSYFLET